jgi:uncharacterized protein
MIELEDRLSRPGHRTLAIVLKVAERCNLACTYCYFFFGGDDSYLKHPALISPQTAQHVAQFLGDAARLHRLERIEVALHGGEPLLLKPKRMAHLIEALHAAMPSSCELEVALQTNGVLIDEKWIDLFEEFEVGIGISLDGPRQVNDLARLDKKGRSSFDETIAGWWLLKAAAKDGRIKEPGILSVISPTTDAQTFAFFTQDLEARSLNFLLPDRFHDAPGVEPGAIDRVGRSMIDIFDEWSAQCDPAVKVRFVNDALLPMIAPISASSSHKFREDLSRAMTIASDGTIYVEDTIRGAFAGQMDETLNVAVAEVADVLGHPHWQMVAAAAQRLPRACQACRYGEICQGGPLVSRFSSAASFDNPSLYCSALYDFHRHVEREVGGAGRLLPLEISPILETPGREEIVCPS